MLIYKITNDVNSKLYIGQTTKTLEERIAVHYNAFCRGIDYHLYRAMRKYGWDKFHFHVIEDNIPDQTTLNEREIYYINKYDTIHNGYNMALGGDTNIMFSDVIKEKHDAKMRSDEVRNKISATLKARYANGFSEEHRKHLSENKKAFYTSERGQAVKKHHSETFRLSEAHYKAFNDSKNKAVYCIDESGDIVAEFERVKDGAFWWYEHGYGDVKDWYRLSDDIRISYKENKYIRGLKWVYRV